MTGCPGLAIATVEMHSTLASQTVAMSAILIVSERGEALNGMVISASILGRATVTAGCQQVNSSVDSSAARVTSAESTALVRRGRSGE